MPPLPGQLAAATSLTLLSPSPAWAPGPPGDSLGENASSPSLAQAAALGVLALDSLLGKPAPSLAAAGIAHHQLLGTEPGGAPASRSRRIAGGAGALQKYLAPPTPSRPFCTQELSNLLPPVPIGRGNDWPINPFCVPVIAHLKKGKKENVYMSQRPFCLSSFLLMAALSWKILS